MKMRWFLAIFISLFWVTLDLSPSLAASKDIRSQILAYGGKTFAGIQDPDYSSYDVALRDYLVKEISKRYGITLDPKAYSGFDLLEMEALFKCKKASEPFDLFLKMFPRRRP